MNKNKNQDPTTIEDLKILTKQAKNIVNNKPSSEIIKPNNNPFELPKKIKKNLTRGTDVKQMNVYLTVDQIKWIDSTAKSLNMKKNEFMQELIRNYMENLK